MHYEIDALSLCNQTTNDKYLKALKDKEDADRNAKNFFKQKLEIENREEAILNKIKQDHETKVNQLIRRIDEIRNEYKHEQVLKELIIKKKDQEIAKLKAEIWKALHILKIPRLKEYAFHQMNFQRVEVELEEQNKQLLPKKYEVEFLTDKTELSPKKKKKESPQSLKKDLRRSIEHFGLPKRGMLKKEAETQTSMEKKNFLENTLKFKKSEDKRDNLL